ncbi:MAG: thioredoxin domain-containing protein [Deltaproteobacteria bacterium]|nr:thioredoxin domain-containing protein [Deltaproteobacteria bacterium]MBN2670243.1 thioredoxin domain-containing protein [Deltaproteobacteria bacterium]
MNPSKIFFKIAVFWTALLLFGCAGQTASPKSAQDDVASAITPVHAGMQLYIMATCPHCAQAIKDLLPLHKKLNGALDLSIEYIGTVDENGVPDLAHGDREVSSAIIELCVANVAEQPAWLDFMGCLYEDTLWRDIPGNWKNCAEDTAVPVKDVEHCITEGGGEAELVRSIAKAAAEGIQAAPTVIIDNREFVGPLDEEFLLTHLCYFAGKESTRPTLCEDIEKPKPLHAMLLNDIRCGAECDAAREVEFIQALFPAMEILEVDYSESAGKDLFDEMVDSGAPAAVPAMYIQETIDDLGPAAMPLAQYMIEFKDGLLLPLGLEFDPSKEICDNEQDDDGNEQIDCDDPYCAAKSVCRPEISNRVDLFIMSQCPYANMVIPAVDHFLNHLRDNGSTQIAFRFQFIGSEKDGTLYSMHGKNEVDEDLRMACVQELYSVDHTFMKYMMCRAANPHNDDWQKCLTDTMSEKDVSACAEGAQGHRLVADSFQLADALNKNGSPSWLLNNKIEMNARTSSQILAAYCARNDDPACDVALKKMLIDEDVPEAGACQ